LLYRRRVQLGAEIARFGCSVRTLGTLLLALLPAHDHSSVAGRSLHLTEAGVPETLAARVAAAPYLAAALDIADLAERARQPLERAARAYYGVGSKFALDDMRAAARRLPADTQWQKQAVEAIIDDLFGLQADLTGRVLEGDHAGEADPLAAWSAAHAAALAPTEPPIRELRAATAPDLAMLIVVGRQLRQVLG
jgi:glutamate dehydrogenase